VCSALPVEGHAPANFLSARFPHLSEHTHLQGRRQRKKACRCGPFPSGRYWDALLDTRTLQPTKENLGGTGIRDRALTQTTLDLGITRRLTGTASCAVWPVLFLVAGAGVC
jgi:hypothetical protein